MSDVMLLGVLRMPLPDNPSQIGAMEWHQIRDRMRQAADRIQSDADLIERQREALRVARAAMLFYANPFERTDMHGDDVRVPDFYGELNFGETAEEAHAAIDAALKEDGE